MKSIESRGAVALVVLAGALLLAPQSAWAITEFQELRITAINDAPTDYLIWNDDGAPLDTVVLLPLDEVELKVTVATGQLGHMGLQTWGRTGIRVGSTDSPGANMYCFDHTDHMPGQTGVSEFFDVIVPGDACGEVTLEVKGLANASMDCASMDPLDFVLAVVEPMLLPIGPQQPDVTCFPAIERCLTQNANTTVLITESDLLVGGLGGVDPNCGVARVVGVQREDTYGSGLFTLGRAALFTCSDIHVLLPAIPGRPLGAHLVRVIVGDSQSPENFGYCYTYATIRDCTPPVIDACPPEQDLAVDHNCVATLPDYRQAMTTPPPVPFDSMDNISDNCTPYMLLQTKITCIAEGPGIFQDPPPGTIFEFEDGSGQIYCPNGEYQDVALFVVDASGNVSSCTFRVNFVDETPPMVMCPANIELPQFPPSFCGRQLTLQSPLVSDNCCISEIYPSVSGSVPMVRRGVAPTWQFTFPIGRSFVTWHVIDCCGNETTCVQEVRITDVEDPVIECPPDYPIDPEVPIDTDPHECGAYVTVAPPFVSDNCDIQWVVNDYNWTDDASDFYPVGTTVVTWTVVDEDGRMATCDHSITVVDNEMPRLGLCQCVDEYGSISPLNFGIVEINEPPCDQIAPEDVVSQLLDKWLSDYGWWLLFGAHDNCNLGVMIIEFQRIAPGQFLPLLDANDDYIPRTDPFPLGLSHMMFVAQDKAGNYSEVCTLEILVVLGQCGGPPLLRGACCGADGACTELTQADCDLVGGTYNGDGTFCIPNPCVPLPPPPIGACCLGPQNCQVMTEADCDSASGSYLGDDTKCGPTALSCMTTTAQLGLGNPVQNGQPTPNPNPVPIFSMCGWGTLATLSTICVGMLGMRRLVRRRRR